MFRILLILPLIFGFPDLKANWTDNLLDSVRVRVGGEDPLLDRCLKSGFELRYRYEVRLCKRRPLWFDYCPEERVIRHSLHYDPISDKYTLVVDWHGDQIEPRSETIASLEEAVESLAAVQNLPISFLSRGDEGLLQSRRRYLSIRVLSACKGDYNETLARISSVISLGLVRVSGFNTGWVDFRLDGDADQQR